MVHLKQPFCETEHRAHQLDTNEKLKRKPYFLHVVGALDTGAYTCLTTPWTAPLKTSSGSHGGTGPLGCKASRTGLLTLSQPPLLLDFKVFKCCLWETLRYNQGRNLSLRQESLGWKWQWRKAAAPAWYLLLPSGLFVGLGVNNLKFWAVYLSISPTAGWKAQPVEPFVLLKDRALDAKGPLRKQQLCALDSLQPHLIAEVQTQWCLTDQERKMHSITTHW